MSNWIAKAVGKHPGALHRALHVPLDQKISEGKINTATLSKNPTLAKEARLAKTLESFHKR